MKHVDLFFLRNIKLPELSTSMLLGLFADSKDPRGHIHRLAKQGLLQPIKQGVYVASGELGLRPYSKDILANLIYGPSYISLETALSYYGFIPERVEGTTSVCIGNSRQFETSLGTFEYCRVKEDLYPHGICLREAAKEVFCLYATPEKALVDFVYLREKTEGFKNAREYFDYVVESHRLELPTIAEKISLKKIQNLSGLYTHKRVDWFIGELIRRLAQ